MSLTKKDRKIRSISGKDLPSGDGGIIGSGRFAEVIADALRREFGGTRSAVKSVAGLTGANERAVKNWFDAKNGPSGEALVSLIRHSDEVLESVLLLAGRGELVAAKKLVDARQKLNDMIAIIDELQGDSAE